MPLLTGGGVSAAPALDPAAAARWLRSWFDVAPAVDADGDAGVGASLVALTMLRSAGRASIATNETLRLSSLLELLEDPGGELLDAATYDGGFEWNLYASLGTYDRRPAHRHGRAHKEHVDHIPGVWVDLDVKAGGFTDEQHALDLLRCLPALARPSSVVATGTGGVHGYWNLAGATGMEPAEVSALCQRWHAHLCELAGPNVHIDALTEVGRVTKLPGTIRWPKGVDEIDAGVVPAAVRLLYCEDPGPNRRYLDPAWLRDNTEAAWQRHLQRREALIAARRARQAEAAAAAEAASARTPTSTAAPGRGGLGSGSLARMAALVDLADTVTDDLTWEDVLVPAGWSELRPDSEERRIWARPGGEGRKAASTDYRGSAVMTLFSDAPDTGLGELVETGAVLTRYAVLVELWFGGDEAALIRAWDSAGRDLTSLLAAGPAAPLPQQQQQQQQHAA